MFSALFRKKNKNARVTEQKAEALYALALRQTRNPVFYLDMQVPDSFDGRFDLLLLHIFIIYYKHYDDANFKDLSQVLFDVTFRDMDQTLREMGIGDMGVPKHQKRMMKAFNGRMHNYMAALAPERLSEDILSEIKKGSLEEVLKRNLYGSCKEDQAPDQDALGKMAAYVLQNIEAPITMDKFFIKT